MVNKSRVVRAVERWLSEAGHAGLDFEAGDIVDFLEERATHRQLSLVHETLLELVDQGLLVSSGHGRFRGGVAEGGPGGMSGSGVLHYSRRDGCRVEVGGGVEVYVPFKSVHGALHGDRVRVIYQYDTREKRFVGRVREVELRSQQPYVGVIQVMPQASFLLPDSRSIPYDIYVPHDRLNGARHGHKVLVRVTGWPHGSDNPEGEVVEILGMPGTHEVEMHAILAEFNLPYRYPADVEAYANERVQGIITDAERVGRRDFRAIETFTIDPETAKDFDDALSVERLDEDLYRIGVHIADVTHYVRAGDPIDEEARERGTSVYLVDRTVPMLPERLCNDVCSLVPGEERLAMAVVLDMRASDAGVESVWMGPTVIRSDCRFTYAEVLSIIEGADDEHAEPIHLLHGMAQQLRARRFENGSIDFVSDEVEFRLDERGIPVEVVPVEHDESHQLIEEFMLLANVKVAERLGKPHAGGRMRPMIFRVHDRPDQEKLAGLLRVMGQLGKPYRGDPDRLDGRAITGIVRSVRGMAAQPLVDILAVRAMAKAIYTTENIGHYGLAFAYYTHFTSPIRRYPDVLVHRLLKEDLAGEKPSLSRGELEGMAEYASARERVAADAERASVKYKQVEYMSGFLGKEFDGIISGVMEFGFFVQLDDNHCEGLVSVRELRDDHYTYIEDEFLLKGRRRGREFRLGDRIRIEVLRANLQGRFLDFTLPGGSELGGVEYRGGLGRGGRRVDVSGMAQGGSRSRRGGKKGPGGGRGKGAPRGRKRNGRKR